ncbi:hypothetical protein CR513_30402, partial [Mucuna pruriens]
MDSILQSWLYRSRYMTIDDRVNITESALSDRDASVLSWDDFILTETESGCIPKMIEVAFITEGEPFAIR